MLKQLQDVFFLNQTQTQRVFLAFCWTKHKFSKAIGLSWYTYSFIQMALHFAYGKYGILSMCVLWFVFTGHIYTIFNWLLPIFKHYTLTFLYELIIFIFLSSTKMQSCYHKMLLNIHVLYFTPIIYCSIWWFLTSMFWKKRFPSFQGNIFPFSICQLLTTCEFKVLENMIADGSKKNYGLYIYCM